MIGTTIVTFLLVPHASLNINHKLYECQDHCKYPNGPLQLCEFDSSCEHVVLLHCRICDSERDATPGPIEYELNQAIVRRSGRGGNGSSAGALVLPAVAAGASDLPCWHLPKCWSRWPSAWYVVLITLRETGIIINDKHFMPLLLFLHGNSAKLLDVCSHSYHA